MVIDGPSTNNVTANTILFGNHNLSNVRTLAPFCDLGTAGAPFQTIFLTGDIHSLSHTRAADDLLSNTGGAAAVGNLPTFANTNGKELSDSGISLSSLASSSALDNYLTTSGGSMSGPLSMTGTTDSSSITSGSLVTAGGIGVAKNAHLGAACYFCPTQAAAKIGRVNVFGTDKRGSDIALCTDADRYALFAW